MGGGQTGGERGSDVPVASGDRQAPVGSLQPDPRVPARGGTHLAVVEASELLQDPLLQVEALPQLLAVVLDRDLPLAPHGAVVVRAPRALAGSTGRALEVDAGPWAATARPGSRGGQRRAPRGAAVRHGGRRGHVRASGPSLRRRLPDARRLAANRRFGLAGGLDSARLRGEGGGGGARGQLLHAEPPGLAWPRPAPSRRSARPLSPAAAARAAAAAEVSFSVSGLPRPRPHPLKEPVPPRPCLPAPAGLREAPSPGVGRPPPC